MTDEELLGMAEAVKEMNERLLAADPATLRESPELWRLHVEAGNLNNTAHYLYNPDMH